MNPMAPNPPYTRAVMRWLMLCLVLIALMVALGGVTRLTESGLSIVEWKLVSGTLPPLNQADWEAEFAEYQQSPQFQQVNHYFTLADFKRIFWLEYLHRLLGRIIGMAVALPLVYFAVRRALPGPLLRRMVGVALLVGAQGTVGWIMVASGLQHQPRVEPIKLALHLILAFSVFCLILWTRWQANGSPRLPAPRGFAAFTRLSLVLTTLQIALGALVAGLRAGKSYNTYPLMDGQLIPDNLYLLNPWWMNHLESVLTVQFQHRMGAILVVILAFTLAMWGWREARLRPLLHAILGIVTLQFILGIATLLSSVNLWLASAHQLVALALMAHLVRLVYVTPPQKITALT